MDFTQDGKNPSNNVVGISVVVVLHVFIVYALLTGLARKVVEVIQQPVETKIIEEFKPPPPPPPEVKVQAPPQDNVIAAVTNVKPATNDLPTSVAQPSATGEAAPAHTSAKIAGNCEKPEYPRTSLRNEEEGVVTVKLTIGADGNVVDSAVEKSSGFKDLDRATVKAWSLCHFTPAMADGKAVQSSTRMQYVWKLE